MYNIGAFVFIILFQNKDSISIPLQEKKNNLDIQAYRNYFMNYISDSLEMPICETSAKKSFQSIPCM